MRRVALLLLLGVIQADGAAVDQILADEQVSESKRRRS